MNSDILHGFSIKGEFNYLFELLDSTHVVYIGNKSHQRSLKFINESVEIPYLNVWNIYDEVLSQVKIRSMTFSLFLFLWYGINIFVRFIYKNNICNNGLILYWQKMELSQLFLRK